MSSAAVSGAAMSGAAMSGNTNSALKQRIAILGGGVGAVSAAFQLTEEPGWQNRYEITLYQLGHRLGGKGASGRGPDGRIEEHGLHVWLGFYENAFRMIRKAYGELTPGGASSEIQDGVFSNWLHAFRKQSWVGVYDRSEQQTWLPWLIEFPEDSQTPGDGSDTPGLWELTVKMLEWMADSARKGTASRIFDLEDLTVHGSGLRAQLDGLIAELKCEGSSKLCSIPGAAGSSTRSVATRRANGGYY
jgi:uncharacterized protein with NAD-binding domain and iron-sulfur cluster